MGGNTVSAAPAPTFARQLVVGKVGESLIARWLRSRGYSVMPVYEIEIPQGKGPRLYAVEGELVAPDMLVFKGQSVRWIEAKHKEAFTWHRITRRYVTGIDLRHYEHYLRVAAVSPWPVWLLFLQRGGRAKDTPRDVPDSPSGLFGNSIDKLAQCENHRHANFGPTGGVFWAHESLVQLATLDEVLRGSKSRGGDTDNKA